MIRTSAGNLVSKLPKPVHRILSSTWLWVALVAVYGCILMLILAPVLFSSVGADDSYWILKVAPGNDGSFWRAFWGPLTHAFDFDGQARTTALATSERQVIALASMHLATLFSVPPALGWALLKICLLISGIAAVVIFLHQLTYRDSAGVIRRIQPASIAFIAISLPLAVALGAKAQSVGTLNGWLYYPSLTYGPFVVYLLLAALSLKASRLLNRSYRVWVAPVVCVMVVFGLAINLAYEFIALAIPLCVLVLVLQPLPEGDTFWIRWRGKLTVALALAGTYSAIFFWVRWRISEMACQATDTCYTGTVLDLNLRTLTYNFLGALPGGNGAFVVQEAARAGRGIPDVSPLSIGIALLGSLVMLAVWASWSARHESSRSVRPVDDGPQAPAPKDEIRGLLIVIVIGLLIAVGSATITGITARATELIQSPMLSYRNGVVTWSALALSGVTGVRLLSRLRWRVAGYAGVALFLIAVVVGVGMYLPRNIESAQANRSERGTQLVDSLQWEVALGDVSASGDARRCDTIADYQARQKVVSARFIESVAGAYAAFEFYHGKTFCSTGIGLEK